MSDFQSKIISVKDLLIEVNDLLAKQKNALDSTAESIAKYGKNSKLPSDFTAAQKQSIDNSKALQAEATRLFNVEKQYEQLKREKLATQIKIDSQIKSSISLKQAESKETERQIAANKKLSDAYGQLTAKRNETARALQNSIIQTGKYSSETQKLQKEFDTLNKKVGLADKAIGKFSQSNNSIQNLTSGVSNLMGAFGISTGLYLGASIVKDIYETTKQLQSLDLALKMVSGSQQEFASNQSFLRNLAEQYGIEIKGLTKNFTEFWVASKGKLEAEQIKGIFTSISKSVAVMGLSVEQQDSAFLALQQMMSKGTVQAEELKKQLGNALPGAIKAATMAYQALHPEMKVTEQFFMAQMKAGKVLSADLLPELAKQYEKLYGIENVKRAETLQASQERLANSWTELVRTMNESETNGVGSFFSFIINGLANATNALNDFVSSWNQLQKRSVTKGTKEGADWFISAIGDKQGQKAELEALSQQKDARKELLLLRKEEEQLLLKVNQWRKLNKTTVGSELSEEQLRKIQHQIGFYNSILKESNKFLTPKIEKNKPETVEETEKERKAREKAEKERLSLIEKNAKIDYDLAISNAETKRDLIKRDIESFRGSIDEKIQLSMKLAIAEDNIRKIREKESKRTAKGDNRLVNIAENVSFSEQGKILEDNTKRVQNIFKEHFNELDKMPDTIFGDKYKLTDEEKQILKDDEERLKESSKARIKIFNEYIGSFANKSGFGESFNLFTEMDKNGKTMWEKLIQDAKDGKSSFADVFTGISTIAQDTFNVISDASNSRFDAEYSRLEKQKEDAIRFAGDSDAAKQKIEEDYEKRRKEIAKREWKAKQQQTIVNIAMDTAQAIMQIWAHSPDPTGISQGLMTAIISGIGLIQTGVVASQKMPEFWMGTDNAPEGWAKTNERGAEIHTDSKGNIKDFGTNKGTQIKYLNKGDKIYNAEQTKRMLFNEELNSIMTSNNILPSKIEVNSQGMTASEMDSVLSKHFANIQTNHTSIDKNGFNIWSEKNGNRTIQDSNRASRAGFKV